MNLSYGQNLGFILALDCTIMNAPDDAMRDQLNAVDRGLDESATV